MLFSSKSSQPTKSSSSSSTGDGKGTKSSSSGEMAEKVSDEKRKLEQKKDDVEEVRLHQRPGFGKLGKLESVYVNQYKVRTSLIINPLFYTSFTVAKGKQQSDTTLSI